MSMITPGGDVEISIVGRLEGLNKAMDEAEGMMQRRFGEISRTAGIALAGIGGGLTAGFGFAVKAATEFGGEMAKINTLGVTDLGKLEEAVKDVGAAYGLDLKNAALATYDAISSGVTEMDAPLVLAEAAKAATAGVTDLQTSIKLGTAVTNAFGGEMKNMSGIFDQAFIGAKYGVTTFEQLANSIGQVAPVMAAAGLQSDEMFSAVAALTLGGQSTSEAVTGLRGTLTNLIKPSEQAAQMAKLLGIQFDTATLKSKGLSGFLKYVTDAVEKNQGALASHKAELEQQVAALEAVQNPTREQTKALKEMRGALKDMKGVGNDAISIYGQLFGDVQGLAAVLSLGGKQADEFNKTLDEMRKGAGATQEAFDKLVATDPGYAWRQLKADMAVLAISIGESLLPALKRIVDFLKPVVEGFVSFVKEHPNITAAVSLIGASFGALALAASPVLLLLPGLTSAFTLLAGGGAAAGAVAGIGGATVALGGFLSVLGGAVLVGGALFVAVPLVLRLGLAIVELGEAHRQTEATQAALNATTERYNQQLIDQGVLLDKAAMAHMTEAQQLAYRSMQEQAATASMARGWFEYFAGRKESEQEAAQLHGLLLNEGITEQEAAIAVSMGLDAEKLRRLMQSQGEETQSLLREYGIQKVESENKDAYITSSALMAAQEREQAYITGAVKTVENEQAAANDVVSIWERAWNYIASLFGSGWGGGSAQQVQDWGFGGFFASGGVVPGRAGGHSLAMVGEQGPELAAFPAGTRIMSNADMRSAVSSKGAGGPVTINVSFGDVRVSDERDARDLSRRVASEVQRGLRAMGIA